MNYFMIDNLVYGGAERQAIYLLNNNLSFNEVILLEKEIKYQITGIENIKALNPKILKAFQRPLEDSRSVKKLEKKLSSEDKMVSFLDRSNIINIKTAAKTKHKTIISVRNYLSKRYAHPKYFFRKNQIKKYFPKADLIITNSEESKKDLVDNFKIHSAKVKVIYNLIDLEKIELLKEEPIEEEYRKIFNSPTLINVGSLTPQKAQEELIESFYYIKKEFPEYKLIIIGTGKLEKDLKSTINKFNLNKEVFLIGAKSNPFKYIANSDLFILNSNFEGFPNVLMESLATGTPVVTKNCDSGPKELLKVFNYNNKEPQLTKFGYIFPDRKNNRDEEIKELKESVINLINLKKESPEKYFNLIKNCKERAKDFDEYKIIKDWEKVIK